MRTTKLKDGRTLAYEEYGDPKGKPVFYFHGWPASRLSGKQLHQSAKKLGLRIISPDRPGYGYSTIQPSRKLLDFPDDITQLADSLKIKKFVVIGSSGGGPYVLVCAYKIPERLTAAIDIAGLGPLREMDKYKNWSIKRKFILKHWLWGYPIYRPVIFVYMLLLNIPIDLYTPLVMLGRAKEDRKLMKIKKDRKEFRRVCQEAFRQGIKGPLQDLLIYYSDWGFSLKEIKMKVHVWHGKKDRNAQFWMGEYVANQLPKAEKHFLNNSGHFLLAERAEEILLGI
jgi:pimeloyl-ACP methyl ester carboxylesterase